MVLHINDGSDGTLNWAKQQQVKFTRSAENVGICVAMNRAFQLSDEQHVVYMNDDMYVLPGWDVELCKAIEKQQTHLYMLSATMIEPRNTNNPVVAVADYGQSLEEFREEELLKNFKKHIKQDWNGSAWPPLLLHRKAWEQVGGFSEEFSPGMYSDPDLAMKMWQTGCREFRGVGSSLIYHFQSRSTGKVIKNNGRLQFLQKWGILPSIFYSYYLRMGSTYWGQLKAPSPSPALFYNRFRSSLLKWIK